VSLKTRHLPQYGEIARLLIAHGRAAGLRNAEDASVEDAEKLAGAFERMGPTYVKLGQLLSTRADLLPPVYLDALARLQDDVEPVPYREVERIVTDELQVRISNAFRSFAPEPLASASLGQVHKAVLRDGRAVAVKVQRPGVVEAVTKDMQVIEELAGFVDAHTNVGRQFGFAAMVEEFRRAITAELDYELEAENLRVMHRLLHDVDEIVVPLPVNDYSTSRVLTMDYVQGRNVSSIGPLAQLEVDAERLAQALFRAYLDQILVHGFVHADPHPGNVLLTGDGHLALIDLGMVTRVSPEVQDDLLRLLVAVSDGRGVAAAEVLAAMSEHRDDFDRAVFQRQIIDLVQRNQATSVSDLDAGRVIGELARAAGEGGLRPPPELTMLTKALLNLDQVAAKLAPDFDPNAAIRAHAAELMRHKMLQAAAPANLLTAAMDAKEFAERLPGRVNKVMDALARGELTLKVEGIDEKELMRGIQKLANRVTTGLVIAALVVGGAMIMRAGYTALSVVMLAIAAGAGVWLVASTFMNDLPQKHRRRR
jgi:ubiquinone biosynthesis protein